MAKPSKLARIIADIEAENESLQERIINNNRLLSRLVSDPTVEKPKRTRKQKATANTTGE